MMYAIIENGVVQNVILLADPTGWQLPDGEELVQVPDGEAVGPSFTYDGKTFTDPNPQEVIVVGDTPAAS